MSFSSPCKTSGAMKNSPEMRTSGEKFTVVTLFILLWWWIVGVHLASLWCLAVLTNSSLQCLRRCVCKRRDGHLKWQTWSRVGYPPLCGWADRIAWNPSEWRPATCPRGKQFCLQEDFWFELQHQLFPGFPACWRTLASPQNHTTSSSKISAFSFLFGFLWLGSLFSSLSLDRWINRSINR